MDIDFFENNIDCLDKECMSLELENDIIKKNIDDLEKNKDELNDRLKKTSEGVKLVEKIASLRRNTIKEKVESLISECLQSVYGSNYSAEFDYSLKSNRTAVNIYIKKETPDGVVKRDISGIGGGVADTASLPIKLLVLLTSPGADLILFADEPGKHMHDEAVEKLMNFIKEVAHRVGIQIIVCSHHTNAIGYADTVYEIWQESGVSMNKRIK